MKINTKHKLEILEFRQLLAGDVDIDATTNSSNEVNLENESEIGQWIHSLHSFNIPKGKENEPMNSGYGHALDLASATILSTLFSTVATSIVLFGLGWITASFTIATGVITVFTVAPIIFDKNPILFPYVLASRK